MKRSEMIGEIEEYLDTTIIENSHYLAKAILNIVLINGMLPPVDDLLYFGGPQGVSIDDHNWQPED